MKPQVSQMLFVVLVMMILSLEAIESQFLVKRLPGFDGDLPFKLETGYIGVGESDEVQLFYYFIESERNPKDDPLILWMSGGPGCSSISGLYEIGPITFSTTISTMERPVLEEVSDSVTKVASIIFIDQPAGAGFSYAKTPDGYITNDTLSATRTYKFLRKWLARHPTFLNNPLYLSADSYAGIVLPIVAEEIYNGNEIGKWPQINIKGYMLGNPLTDRNGDYNSRNLYAHNMALLSDEIYESAKRNCHGEYLNVDPSNGPCKHALEVVDKCLERINMEHILSPYCQDSNSSQSLLFRRDLGAFDKTDDIFLPQVQTQLCQDDKYHYSGVWANRRDVREALHTLEEFGDTEWVRCNMTMKFSFYDEKISYKNNVVSSVGYHRRLAEKTCRALVYSGDKDMVVPYFATLNWIESLNLSVVDGWRPWFVDEQVAGYSQIYSRDNYNLTFATVKGGGHVAPEYKHKETLSLLKRWLANDTL